ncbi:MAG: hypothetical protein E7616_07335 [Ruminococcaceae bacterium]|nr:hypothetical protein [Oscillospiraceae bacterium]
MENENSVDRGIRLSDLWKVFKRCFLFMICAAILCGAVVGLYTEFFVSKEYAVTLKFKVKAVDTTGGAGQNLSVNCVPDIVELFHSDTDLAKAVLSKMTTKNDKGESIKVATTPENITTLQESLTSSYSTKSSVFTITLTHTDAQVAYDMAVAMADVAPSYFTNGNKISLGSNGDDKGMLSLVRGAEMSNYTEPVYPHVLQTTLLGGILGAILCYAIFFLWYVFDTTIRTEEELKQICDYPVLGQIPEIEREMPVSAK